MKKLKPFNEDAEVIGRVFKAFFTGVNLDHYPEILRQYGLNGAHEIDEEVWYKHALCMDLFREIEKRPAIFDVVALGIASVREINTARDFANTQAALAALPGLVASNHRNSTDYIKVEFPAPSRAVIEDHTIWPHDSMYGVLWEVVRIHASDFVLRRTSVGIDPVTGDEYGVYEVHWQDRVREPVAG